MQREELETLAESTTRASAAERISMQQSPWWRKSTIRRARKISRTLALKCYKLDPSDLEGLVCIESPERDVERAAWKKYGGPAGFESHLDDTERAYNGTSSASPLYTSKPLFTATSAVHKKISTPALLPSFAEIYQHFPTQLEILEQAFTSIKCKWLWDAATRVLSFPVNISESRWSHFTQAEELAALSGLLPLARTYPRRPASPPPASPSFDIFREVLKRPNMRDKLVLFECLGGRRLWCWDANYMTELFTALIGIIEEHGCGEEGWASARWEVYDAHSTHLDGLTYRNKRWYDGASDWLRGTMDLPGEHAMTTRQDNKSAFGRWYNSLLPRE
ncbi:hypothetical protein C8F04DRAFT_1336177 [Mycena alexandri]|uniref:Uncharacterized protein n=1 Tax=Mycena alexandri TaxID=1745969 RepID=A0AAD6X5Y4_9AGAR|nr:hypothetical protein C8F04DRAFT_1336177 [Mycena alexandri]